MELIDVSSVNGSVDWKQVRRAGIVGVWLKATEGVTYVNPRFAIENGAAGRAGLRVGAYHFARPDNNSPISEAVHFCDVIGSLGRRDLKPVLDFETYAKLKLGPAEMAAWAHAFSQHVHAELGRAPIFYSYSNFIEYMQLTQTIGNGLWLADYGPNDGTRHKVTVPEPWKRYVAHQYTSRGTVRGVTGYVDRSYVPPLRLQGVLAYPVRGLL
jgi:lysozyme